MSKKAVIPKTVEEAIEFLDKLCKNTNEQIC